MKKFLAVMFIVVSLLFVSCGPNIAELEKAKQDSIAKADSITAVIEKAKADSIAKTIAVDTPKVEVVVPSKK